jgi:hypothetical protein
MNQRNKQYQFRRNFFPSTFPVFFLQIKRALAREANLELILCSDAEAMLHRQQPEEPQIGSW